MTKEEEIEFEKFIVESFEEGNISRELRLSKEEVDYIHERFPKLTLKSLSNNPDSTEKRWYEVRVTTSF